MGKVWLLRMISDLPGACVTAEQRCAGRLHQQALQQVRSGSSCLRSLTESFCATGVGGR